MSEVVVENFIAFIDWCIKNKIHTDCAVVDCKRRAIGHIFCRKHLKEIRVKK